MSLITLFTTPKPFTNPHIATIQRNALCCWSSLGEDVEVLMIGDEVGMGEVAAEYHIKHLPEVEVNEWGTPLVSSIFALARGNSASPLLAYLNADILVLPDFVSSAHRVMQQEANFLLVGQRWDLDVRRLVDYSNGWADRLRMDVRTRGRLHAPAGSDYFIYPRHQFTKLPDFAIGRAGWDNWMIYQARQQGWPVIDATDSVTVIHQDHDYSHLPGGKPHYDLVETDVNVEKGGGLGHMYMLLDADHEFVAGEVRTARLTLPRLLRRAERFFAPRDGSREGLRWSVARRFRRARRRLV